MRVVEIRMLDANTLPEAMAGMRQWLDHRHFQPAVFRSTFGAAGVLLRIEFANAAEANEFAQAFDGTVQASMPLQNLDVWPQPTPGGSDAPDAGRIDTTDTTLVADREL
jgi:hypothetical protein